MRVLLLLSLFLAGNVAAQFQDSTRHSPRNFDERLFFSINHWGDDAQWLDKPMVFITNTAFVPVLGVPVALFAVGQANNDRDLAVAGFTTFAGIASTGLIGEFILKNTIRRKRPYHVIEGTRLITEGAHGFSFPSGHSSSTFSLATGLSLHFPKWYVIAPSFAYATIVALSRPYLGAHYPSDLLAGAILGVGMQFLWYELEKGYKDKWKIFPSAESQPPAYMIDLKFPF
jgi:membrane-associated phospholipid phosphatase